MSTPPPEPSLLRRWGFSRAGWRDNLRGEWWLAAQAALIAAVVLAPALPSPRSLGLAWPLAARLGGALLLVAGLALALQALLRLGPSLTPLPEPMEGAPFVREGPYERCRHPLYQAVLACALGVALLRGSLLHLALLLALAGVLGSKARREERSLERLHPDYGTYRASTGAIVPGLPWLDWRA
ncbi:MAG: methyltransferase family protein [Cyanobium sp.]